MEKTKIAMISMALILAACIIAVVIIDKKNNSSDHVAPDFTVIDMDGNEVKLSDYKGKPVVLNFWATWCGYCVKEMPHFDQAYRDNPDVQFLMINVTDGDSETMSKAKSFIKESGYEFPVFFDTKLEATYIYGADAGIPLTYFINAEGELITYAQGMIDAETLARAIEMIK